MTFTRITTFLQELMHQLHYSTSLNLSGKEILFLVLLGVAVWLAGRKRKHILPGYLYFYDSLYYYPAPCARLRRKHPLEPALLAQRWNLGR